MAIRITENTNGADTEKTYTVKFFSDGSIDTTVTHDPTVVTNWIEWNYSIRYLYDLPGITVGLSITDRPDNRVATLQLCISNRCLVYQIIHSDNNNIPQSLATFLSGEYKYATFVGVGVKSDLEKLQRDYGIGGGAIYKDLLREYGRDEMNSAGLRELASVVLGKDVEKPAEVSMSRWDQRRLTPEQVKYACVDAYLSYKIGRALGIDLPPAPVCDGFGYAPSILRFGS